MDSPDRRTHGKAKSGGRSGRKKSGETLEDAIAAAIEFLISQGHSFRDIRGYSLPQLLLFIRLATDRLSASSDVPGKKKPTVKKSFGSYQDTGKVINKRKKRRAVK